MIQTLLVMMVLICRLAYGAERSVASTQISVPSGPGSIEGLGESFEPQLNTGTYSMGLPLKLPQVRGAVQPEVRFAYNSGSGNGPLGLGWRMDVPALQRQTDKGLPQYTTNDTFVTLAGEELVALADGTFRAENEASFTRWENLGANGWRATRRDGTVLRFGQTPQSRQDHPELGAFRWMLESAQDLNSNRVEYSYQKDAGEIYLAEVRYGLHATLPSSYYRLTFEYETNRLDSLADYRARFRAETRLRLRSATLSLDSRRLRFWQFDYKTNSHLSLLSSFRQFGDERSQTNSTAVLNRDFLPAVTFDYFAGTLGEEPQWTDVAPYQNIRLSSREADLVDVNRDGLPDVLLYEDGKFVSYLNRGPGIPFALPQAFTSAAYYPPLDSSTTRLTDLRGDGTLKVLIEQDGSFYYRPFTSGTSLGSPTDYLVPGNFPFTDPEVQLIDIDNDRALDFVATDTGDSTFAMALSRAGKGSATVTKSKPTALAQQISFAAGWQFADLNGDRMPDLAVIGTVDEGGTVFYPGKGYGEFDELQRIASGPEGPTDSDRSDGGLQLVDLDGDGLADLVSVRSGVVKIWANRSGKEWARPVVIAESEVPLWNGGSTNIRFADMNGNGSVDIVWNDPDQNIFLRYLDLHPATKPNIMARMENGMGRSLDIEYRTSTDYRLEAERAGNPWSLIPPFPIPVVSAFTERDGLGSTYRTTINYRNGYYDGTEREFRGFEIAVRSDLGNDSQGAPTLLTEYLFDTGAETEALKGKPLRVTRRSTDGNSFDQVESIWTARQLPLIPMISETRRVTYAIQDNERTTIIEQGRGTPVTLLREFSWDDYGNQIRLADYGRVEGANSSAWDDERVTDRTFSAEFPQARANWILNLPVEETITDENGIIVTATESFYDDETFNGNNAGTVSRGNLTLQRRLVDPTSNYKIASVRNRYDGYGNVRQIYDPLGLPSDFSHGHAREITYDPVLHTYPIAETIHIGLATPPLLARADYDFGLGVMLASADFNTNQSFYAYDTFGRISSITKPFDSTNAPTELYDYQLGQPLPGAKLINYITARKRETPGADTLDSRLFFDGLGRKVMVRAEGEIPEQTVVTDTVVYNDRRAVWKKYLPYFDTDGLDWKDPSFNSGFVETHYDSLGRVIRAYQPEVEDERVFADTTYEPLSRLTRDEEQTRTNSVHYGSAMRHTEDGLRNQDGAGRLREVHEIVKITGSGAAVGDPETWITRYEYDLLDQLTRITDSQENVKIMRYDGLARLVFMDDPDRGEMHYVYDDASNLKQTTDNKKQVIEYNYDGANRILTENYLDGLPKPDWRLTTPNYSVSTNYSVLYHYDVAHPDFPGSNARGQLAFVQDLSGEEHLSYDSRNRIVSQTKRIPDPILSSLYPITNVVSRTGPISTNVFDASVGFLVPYTTGYTYDSLDRLVELTYPDGDMVTNIYNSRGLLTRITGGPSGSIISNITYEASAQLQRIRYGNSVVTTYDYDPRLRLKHLLTVPPSQLGINNQRQAPLIDFTYTFDAASNIRRIDDNRDLPRDADYFRRQNTQIYDYDSVYRLKAAEYPVMLSGSPARINYLYDRIGNMTSQTSNIPDVDDKGAPTADLGTMQSGGALGTASRVGKGTGVGPHALSEISNQKSQIHLRRYAYDLNGNMTEIDGLKCAWDFKDRLIAGDNNKMHAEYSYDYANRRIMKRVWQKKAPASGEGESKAPSLTTLYINKSFEIRDYDSPIKYVWNGGTRIARVTRTLDCSPERRQFLRLHSGWNLASINVGQAQTQLDPANQALLKSAVFWTNNLPGGEFLPISGITRLDGGTVAWLNTTHSCVLTLAGTTLREPANNLVPSDRILAELMDARFSRFDASAQAWQERLPRELAFHSTVPNSIPTGESVFISIENTNAAAAISSSTSTLYYHQDHLRSSGALAAENGAQLNEFTSYAFGHPRFARTLEPVEPFTFIQKERDAESHLTYVDARYLSGQSARFCSWDPAARVPNCQLPPTYLNPYSYANNNPVKFVDPSGESALTTGSILALEVFGGPIGKGAAPVLTFLDKWTPVAVDVVSATRDYLSAQHVTDPTQRQILEEAALKLGVDGVASALGTVTADRLGGKVGKWLEQVNYRYAFEVYGHSRMNTFISKGLGEIAGNFAGALPEKLTTWGAKTLGYKAFDRIPEASAAQGSSGRGSSPLPEGIGVVIGPNGPEFFEEDVIRGGPGTIGWPGND